MGETISERNLAGIWQRNLAEFDSETTGKNGN